jgi:hypothetical protein
LVARVTSQGFSSAASIRRSGGVAGDSGNAVVLQVSREELHRAAEALQRLVLRLLEDLLGCRPGLQHGDWFGAEDARVFDRMGLRRIGLRWALARFCPPLRRVLVQAPSGSRMREPRATWSSPAVFTRLQIECHGIEGLIIPDRFLNAVGLTAWDSPWFRLHAAALVTEHLRSRLMVSVTDLPPPRIVPEVCWMIIATSDVRMPFLARLRLAYRPHRRALERLRSFGLRVIEETGMPEEFWAHWLSWHVNRVAGSPSMLPLKWHSWLRDPGTIAASAPTEQRLAAAYAAWYPVHKE